MESRLIVIRTYSLYNNGLVDKAKLEGAGINCFLKEDSTGLVQPFFSETGGGIKLMVMAEDAEIAETILNDHFESELQPDEENEIGSNEEKGQSLNQKKGCLIVLGIAIGIAVSFYLFF